MFFIVFLQCVSNALLRRSMVLLFPVSSSGKPSLCFLSRLIYADGSLVIPVVCYSLQRFAGNNSRNKQFQSESRSVEGRSVGLWFSRHTLFLSEGQHVTIVKFKHLHIFTIEEMYIKLQGGWENVCFS